MQYKKKYTSRSIWNVMEHIFSIYNFTLYILLNFCLEENPAVLSHQTGNQSSLRTVRLHLCWEEHGLSDGGDQLQGVCLHRSVTPNYIGFWEIVKSFFYEENNSSVNWIVLLCCFFCHVLLPYYDSFTIHVLQFRIIFLDSPLQVALVALFCEMLYR